MRPAARRNEAAGRLAQLCRQTGGRGLVRTAAARCGKGATASDNFATLRHKLKRYGVNCVIGHFECLEVSKAKRKGLAKRLKYFRSHQPRMQYHLYRREGWPIGSGEVEGACKSLVEQRTDLSGQRWSPDGALNVLWVRALVRDGLHDLYWNAHATRSLAKRAA